MIASDLEPKVVVTRAMMPFDVLAIQSPHRRWNSLQAHAHCAVMRFLIIDDADSIALCVIDSGGIDDIFKDLRSIVDRIRFNSMEEIDFFVVKECFHFLSGRFKLRAGMVRKCLRSGLIKALSYLRKDLVAMENGAIDDLKRIVEAYIPPDLVNVETILLLASIARTKENL